MYFSVYLKNFNISLHLTSQLSVDEWEPTRSQNPMDVKFLASQFEQWNFQWPFIYFRVSNNVETQTYTEFSAILRIGVLQWFLVNYEKSSGSKRSKIMTFGSWPPPPPRFPLQLYRSLSLHPEIKIFKTKEKKERIEFLNRDEIVLGARFSWCISGK